MVQKLYCDLETYSSVPIKHGVHAYAEQVEVLLFTYAFEDGPAQCWDLTDPVWDRDPSLEDVPRVKEMPTDLWDALTNPDVLTVWHNGGMFDRIVIKHALPVIYHAVPIERWYDTMVQALAHSLPGSLDQLCKIFKIPEAERKLDGKQLIRLFCMPPPANVKRARATRETHPREWEQFVEYAKQDIPAMRAVHKRMPTWNYEGTERALWWLDQRINDRGVQMDVELAHAAIRAVGGAQKSLAARTHQLTGGELDRATRRDALLAHLVQAHGVELPDLQKSTLERRINDTNLPAALRELLAVRLQSCTTSTSKYQSLIKGVSSDGRLCGTLQFNGASRTGRWAGRLFQPQNLPRPKLTQTEIDQGIQALKLDCADLVTDNVMELTSSAIRGVMIAPPGKKLVVADLSNIEGRVLAWLAGENWKLKAFANYDTFQLDKDGQRIPDGAGDYRRMGHDLYALAYAKSFGVTPESVMQDKKAGGNQRQIGKTQELALGYEGSVGAFFTFAAAYNLDLEAMAEDAVQAIPRDIWAEASDMLVWTRKQKRSTFGLSSQAWLVCESFKRLWRRAHPETVLFWRELGDAVRDATSQAGTTITCRRLRVRRDGNWLRIRLPSGRFLCYPSPRVDDNGQISYRGIDQYSRQWSRLKTYGGKLVENATQAASRDVIAANMPLVEAAGYEIVLTVHDEIIAEAPDTPEFNAEHLASILSAHPPWAEGLPLAATGFETYRYRKD